MTTTRGDISTSLFIYVKDAISGKINRLAIPADTQIGTLDKPAELQLSGRFSMASRDVSVKANDVITMSNHDTMLCISQTDSSTGSATVYLPATPRAGQIHYIKDVGGGALSLNITVQGANASQTIDGQAQVHITTAHGGISCFWNGSSWSLLVSSSGGGTNVILYAGSGISIVSGSFSGSTTYTVSSTNTSTGDPNAKYITFGLTSSLSQERVLTQGQGINITDTGANGQAVVAVQDSGVVGGTYNGPINMTVDSMGRLTSVTGTSLSGSVIWEWNGVDTTQFESSASYAFVEGGQSQLTATLSVTSDASFNTPSGNYLEYGIAAYSSGFKGAAAWLIKQSFPLNYILDMDYDLLNGGSGEGDKSMGITFHASVSSGTFSGIIWAPTTAKVTTGSFTTLNYNGSANALFTPAISPSSNHFRLDISANRVSGSRPRWFAYATQDLTGPSVGPGTAPAAASPQTMNISSSYFGPYSSDWNTLPCDRLGLWVYSYFPFKLRIKRMRVLQPNSNFPIYQNYITQSGSADSTASYVVMSTNPTIPNARFLQQGLGITITDGGPSGPVTISNSAVTPPVSAQYITLALDATLTAERVLAVGNALQMTDGGANGNVTLKLNESILAVTGTTTNFQQPVSASAGFTGSLQSVGPGLPYMIAGANMQITTNSKGQIQFDSTGGGGSGGGLETYVLITATSSLPNSRVLSASTGLIIEDFGPASTVDFRINDNVVATVSGSRFTGPVVGLGGFTGSIFTVPSGVSYIAAGSNMTVTSQSNGQLRLDAATQAPTNATYVTLSTNATLTSERVLTVSGTSGLTLTDAGPNGNATLAINNNIVATVSGTTFTGPVSASGGLTGSIQVIAPGLPYLIGGTGITITTASNGQITFTTLGASGSAAPNDSSYLVLTNDPALSNERALVVTSGLTLTDAGANSSASLGINNGIVATISGSTFLQLSGSLQKTAAGLSYLSAGSTNVTVASASNGQITISVSSSVTAPIEAQYLVLALDGTLTQERVLVPSTGLKATDAGANGNYTLTINDNVVATISGSRFTGPVVAAGGLTGSLQQTSGGLSYLVAGSNMAITSASNGQITISSTGGGGGDPNAPYTTFAATASLPNAKVFQDGIGTRLVTTTSSIEVDAFPWIDAFDINFTVMPAFTASDGNFTMAGYPWTGKNIASGADFVGIVPGDGLRIDTNAASTDFFNGNETSPVIRLNVADVIPRWNTTDYELRLWTQMSGALQDAQFEYNAVGFTKQDFSPSLRYRMFFYQAAAPGYSQKGQIDWNTTESAAATTLSTTGGNIGVIHMQSIRTGTFYIATSSVPYSTVNNKAFPDFNALTAFAPISTGLASPPITGSRDLAIAFWAMTLNTSNAFSASIQRLKLQYRIKAAEGPTNFVPNTAMFLVASASGQLVSERVLRAGSNITLTDGGAGQSLTINSTATGGDLGAPYVVLSNTSSLTNERALTAGSGIAITDNGANSTVVISTNLSTIQTASNEWSTAFDIQFGLLSSQSITDGVNSIGGITWTAQNIAAGASAASIVPGDGLRLTPNTTNTDYNPSAATRTAPNLSLKLSSVIPNFAIGSTKIRLWAVSDVADATTDTRVSAIAIDRTIPSASVGQGIRMVDGFVTARGGRSKQFDIGYTSTLTAGSNVNLANKVTVIQMNDIQRGQGTCYTYNPGTATANTAFPALTALTASQLFTIVGTAADSTFGTTYLTGSDDVSLVLAAFTVSTTPGSFSGSFKRLKLEYSNAVTTQLGGPSLTASYLVVSASGANPNERTLTAGTGVSIRDNGPGQTAIISSTILTSSRWVTAFDIDFTTQSAFTASNGSQTMAGLTWIGENIAANADFVGIVPGDGLRIDPNAVASDWSLTARSAPLLKMKPASVVPNFDLATTELRLWVVFDVFDANQNFENAYVAFDRTDFVSNANQAIRMGRTSAGRVFSILNGLTDAGGPTINNNNAMMVTHLRSIAAGVGEFFSYNTQSPINSSNVQWVSASLLTGSGGFNLVTGTVGYSFITGSNDLSIVLAASPANTANLFSASIKRLRLDYAQVQEITAPTDPTYLVLTSSAVLANSRKFTAGPGITVDDKGPGGIYAVTASAWAKVVDTNFTQLTPQTFTDGTASINGNPWIVLNTANSQGVRIDANGLVMSASSTNITKFYQNADNAPQIKINIGTLIPEFVLGQSQLRAWILGGSNGNANHEVLTFFLQKAPWTGGVSNQPTWIWALGAYDSLNPHNGAYTTQGTTSRTDVDFTSRTAANSPSTSVWGFHWENVGNVGFYYRTITGSLSADTNDTVNQFKYMKLGAQERAASQSTFAASSLNDIGSSHAMTDASSLELGLAISTVNTAAHLIATVKRIVIEWKP